MCVGLFGVSLALLVYVFVKYLVIKAECKRFMMMVFYIVAFVDLSTRMAIMITLNWNPFIAKEIILLSVISQFFSLLVGTVHAWILS